ncbi:MAG TPA: threonine--tRNA ligase [Candidatus Diapherotrites archaeon]|jgi:threonyl-tRNA synthetase|nr:threonine--tRNA ligase [Candidatus Diapherotrites archaeon]
MEQKKIKITFPDGTIKEIEYGVLAKDVIKQEIGEGLFKAALAVKINDELKDISTPITKDCNFQVITFKDPEGKQIFWHSSSHVLALAVKRLYPDVKLGIGPAIAEGFYYDFDVKTPFKPEDLENIEKEIEKIIKEDLTFEKIEINYEEAKKILINEKYKLELINDLQKENQKISFYKLGDWYELCKGPHVPSTGKIKALKLLKTSGAYWKGDTKNPQLQRIYGISFPEKQELKEYLTKIEEAAKRDHRKIGRELDLFSFHDEAPGMPFFHNNGTIIYNTLVEFISQIMIKRNYEINKTPMILNKELWLRSGHWDHYKDNMYFVKIDDQEHAVKPMNCPGNILIYKTKQYSYKDLPVRAGEFGLVHRHELSGVLSGLFRVRCFTQDDAHIFCTPDQMKDEIKDIIDFVDEVYSTFGFKYQVELSTKPEKAMGDPKLWEIAENTLKEVLNEMNLDYKILPGEGAFYGPKIDFHLTDCIGRTWQCGTVQLDFQMPEKFDLTYIDKNDQKQRPVMIHRAIIGSVERFMGILIENFEGKLPLWISPVQAIILPIADRHNEYSKNVQEIMRSNGLRVEINTDPQTLDKKIRNAELQKINYIIVVGDKEIQNNTINVRTRDNHIIGEKQIQEFINELLDEIKTKAIK